MFRTHLLRTVPFALSLGLGLPVHGQSHTLVESVPSTTTVFGQHAPALRVWKLGCVEGSNAVSETDFLAFVDAARALEASAPHFAPAMQSGASLLGGFDLGFTVSSPPAGALGAVAAVEAYYDARIASSHATGPVQISVNFAPLGGSTGMSTSSQVFVVDYVPLRNSLIATMDADDVIEPFLPAGSVHVRFDGTSPTVSNCWQVYVSAGCLAATVPGVTGLPAVHATITVNTNYTWDYDPTNGITAGTACFQTAFAHEVGHALGFASAVELPITVPLIQDLYRFRRTANNPTSFATFTSMTRLVDSLPDDDAELDFVDFEYAMEDSTPFGAGHFREATPRIGAMDPVLSLGESYWPNFMLPSDFRVLDALGYDIDDPSQSGLARFSSMTRLDENPTSADSVRWQVDFTKRVGGVDPTQFSVSGVAGSAVQSVTPVAGNAVTFMGLNWIDLFDFAPATSLGQGAFTMECSIRPTPQSAPAPHRYFLSVGNGGIGQGVALYLDADNRVRFAVAGFTYAWNSPVLNDGNWHHVAVTSTGGTLATVTLYVDGVNAGANVIPLNIGSGSCVIGRTLLDNSTVHGMIGAVDEVRFWNQPLSAGILHANRDLALPSGAPLVGCFPLDVLADLGYSFPWLLDTPEETLAGGFGQSNWNPGANAPVLVSGRAASGNLYVLTASVGSGSGTLTPSFSDNDAVTELRSGAPLNGPGTGTSNGDAYAIQHASGSSFCDGSGCPCANDAPPGTHVGCLSSIGSGGRLRATGTTSIAAGALTLRGSQMPNSNALYLAGDAQTTSVLGDGVFCVGGTIVRLGTKTNVGGASQFPDLGQIPISTRVSATPGTTSYFQIWYRNAAAFCTAATFNDSNGWRVTWTP